MEKWEIIDFHTHIFPRKIAGRAMDILIRNSGNLMPCADGTREGLLALMDADGVGKAVALGIATNDKQMPRVNDYAISIGAGRLIGFGSVYPKGAGALEELHRLKESGVLGVKFHPEYQSFFVDDDALAPVYETIRKLNLITVFHAGADIGFAAPVKASPRRLAAILPAFGKTPVVLAHMGGYILWDEVLEVLAGGPAYFDTSFCYSRIPLPLCREIVKKHGADRILFGSDAPWCRPANEILLIDALGLNEQERAGVLSGNAKKLLANRIACP
ncbi:MAG: amidohydrolase family protein [Oscillospiraceae bacterium]|nr:amidohydrolase family protein [Oscillospiraceae bacterium]